MSQKRRKKNAKIVRNHFKNFDTNLIVWHCMCLKIISIHIMKCHQRLDEILILSPAHPGNQQSCMKKKKKTLVRRLLFEICVHIHSKSMLIAQECVKFCRPIAWQSFLVNNLADFPDVVQVKKNQDFIRSLVVFHYRNICYSIFQLNSHHDYNSILRQCA